MSTLLTDKTWTPEELLSLPDRKRYELVNGQLVELPMGFESGRIGTRLIQLLANHCYEQRLGWVLGGDVGFQCFPDDPNRVRRPDAAFVDKHRLSAADEPKGHCRLAPDLAAEVVSPQDLSVDVSRKVEEYLAAGVRLVWVIHPSTRRIDVHRRDGTGVILRATDELNGEDVLPGFIHRVAELFLPPPGTIS